MKDYNEEYFYLEPNGINYPSMDFDGPDSIRNFHKFLDQVAMNSEEVISLHFCDPVPRKPKMADAHRMASNCVFSQRMKETIEQMNLKDVQFIPAAISDINDELIEGYFIPHIYNVIRCADMEKSIYRDRNSKNAIDLVYKFDKLVLNNEILDKIPLEERLVLYVDQSNIKTLYHVSVVKKIMALKPKGVILYQLSTYNPRKPFQAEFLDWVVNGDD